MHLRRSVTPDKEGKESSTERDTIQRKKRTFGQDFLKLGSHVDFYGEEKKVQTIFLEKKMTEQKLFGAENDETNTF